MSIRDTFCPKCGAPTGQPGLCPACKIGSTPWFSCEARVRHTECPSCGAIKQVNTWTDSERTRDEIGPDLARSAVKFSKDVKNPQITVTIDDISTNRSRADLVIRGMLYKKPVQGSCSVEIVWDREQCDRCNRISGSYHEGVVQVRGDGRLPSTYEVQMASSIAQGIEDSLQAGGERLSFISEMTPIRDGLDIIIGSQHIGLKIAQGIVAQLGGRYTTHPKLVGEKNRYYEVERVESHFVRATDLIDGAHKSIRDDDIESIVGNARNAEPALVAYAEKKTIGIMDPRTQQTREIRPVPWMEVRAGDSVSVVRDGDHLIMVR